MFSMVRNYSCCGCIYHFKVLEYLRMNIFRMTVLALTLLTINVSAQIGLLPKHQTVLGEQVVTASESTNLNVDIPVYKGQSLEMWVRASNTCDMVIRFDVPYITVNATNGSIRTTNWFLAGPGIGGGASWTWRIATTNTVNFVAHTNFPNTLFAGSPSIRLTYITNLFAAPLRITNITASAFPSW